MVSLRKEELDNSSQLKDVGATMKILVELLKMGHHD